MIDKDFFEEYTEILDLYLEKIQEEDEAALITYYCDYTERLRVQAKKIKGFKKFDKYGYDALNN